jgi:RNA polymerase sigma-70 factor (ECF subfamily)
MNGAGNRSVTSDKRGLFDEEAVVHMDAVYRFALRLAGDPDQANDLLQETYLRAWKAWDQYAAGTNAKSWLFTICRNLFLRQVERGKRQRTTVEERSPRESTPSGGDIVNPLWAATSQKDPEGRFFDSIVDDQVVEAIEALPEEYRTAVVMSDVEGLPYAEIAEATGVPVGTVKSRLFRGRRQLQAVLYEFAVEMGYIDPAADDEEDG